MRTTASTLALALAVGLVVGWGAARAQTPTLAPLSNLRLDTLAAGDTLFFPAGETPLLRTLEVRVLGDTSRIPAGRLRFTDASASVDTVALKLPADARIAWRYRVLVARFTEPYARLDSLRLENRRPQNYVDETEQTGTSVAELRRELGAVDYRGTFGRGLRFGNSQSLVLDSRLDLQLDGDLGEGLKVAAVVSDQNIPLQPEGNTVQLREFDRVFVRISKDQHALTAGDYSLRSDRGHFLRFDKNLQGLTYEYGLPQDATRGRASVASARGQFQRIQLPVADGNQGPYRLTGAQGQPFVIVLSGTERLTLDGRPLERGLDRDYVIDYNRGEITFQPRLLVNRFQRILVEYEYVDQEYLRTLAAAEATHDAGPWSFHAQGLQQQDGLRRTGSPLTEQAEEVLRMSDGTGEGVLVPSQALIEQGSANPLRYVRLPNPDPDCTADSIWRYEPEAAFGEAYSVGFTEVGIGNGDYQLAPTTGANGASYSYVAPDENCAPRGSYRAERRVQTPRALRLVSFGGGFVPDSSLAVVWELAGSSADANRYAPGAEQSFAGFAGGTKSWELGASGGELAAGAHLEGTGDGFRAIAPWRSPEFNRTWNLGTLAQQATEDPGAETLADAEVGWTSGGEHALNLFGELGYYRQAGRFTGFRQNWRAGYATGRWTFGHDGDRLAATRGDLETGRTRLGGTAQRRGPRWTQRFAASTLLTQNYDAVLDAADAVDRRVSEWAASTERAETDSTWALGLSYTGRADARGDGGGGSEGLSGDGISHQVDVSSVSPLNPRQGLELTATYRRTDGVRSGASPEDAKDYYLGRVSHRWQPTTRGWLRTQSTAEAGSGQERRVSVQYLKVQPGLGQYIWRDYNGDGVEELDEFEVAVFADSASYIKTVLLTDEFVATNTLALNQTVQLDAGRIEGGGERWWGRLSALNTASLRRRAVQDAGYGRLLAVNLPEADTTVVGDNLSWRSALYLNRARNAFQAELEHRQLADRSISLQGLQQLRTTGQGLNVQQPLGQAWRLTLALDRERRRSRSEGLAARNFVLDSREVRPGLSFQPTPNVRAGVESGYREGEALGLPERVSARSLKTLLELRVPSALTVAEGGSPDARRNPFAGASVRAEVERISQRFSGEADSPSGFALLEGLRPGRSWIWSANVDQQLGKALQLSLRYEGRQVGVGRVVHSGQAQLQAVF